MSFFYVFLYALPRFQWPMEDRDKDTEELEMSQTSWKRRSEKTSTDWLRMKNHLQALQLVRVTIISFLEITHQNLASELMQSVCLSVCLSLSICLPTLKRCVEEEEQLQLKKRQIRTAELSLSKLQRRKLVRHGTYAFHHTFLQCSFSICH